MASNILKSFPNRGMSSKRQDGAWLDRYEIVYFDKNVPFSHLKHLHDIEICVTSTNLRPAWTKDDSISFWTLATLIRLDDGKASGMGESTGEGEGEDGDEGEDGRVGGNSW